MIARLEVRNAGFRLWLALAALAALALGCAYNGTVNVGYRSAISERGNAETTIEGGGSPTLEIPLEK